MPAGRGKLAVRALELARLLPDLVEQPDILDRDHRLGGERFQGTDLALAERASVETTEHDHADGRASVEQRRADGGVVAARPGVLGTQREIDRRLEVLHRDRRRLEEGAGTHGRPVVRVAQVVRHGHRSAVRRQPQLIAIRKHDGRVLGSAEPQRVLDDRFEDRPYVRW